MATPSRAAAAELLAPLHGTVAAAWMASGTAAPGLGDGAPVLGDGAASEIWGGGVATEIWGARSGKKGKQGLHRRAQPSPGGVDALHRRAYPQPGGVECPYRRVYPQPGGVEAVTAISFACLLHQDKYGSNLFKTNMSTSHVYNSSNKTYN